MAVPVGWDFANNPGAWALNTLPLMRSDNDIYGWSPGRKTSRRAAKRKRTYPAISSRGNVIRPELKFSDNATSFAVALQNGSVFTALNLVEQGIEQTMRTGMKFNIKSISVNGEFVMQQRTGTSASNALRIIIFIDHQANGAVPAESDVLQQATNVYAQHDAENAHRFTFLHDKVYVINASSHAWNGSAMVSQETRKAFSIFKRVNVPIYYDNAASAITGVTQNNVLLMVYKESAVPLVDFRAVTRVRFTDI